MMRATRLHGPQDLRHDSVPAAGEPSPATVRLRIDAVGVCGSDLHLYETGSIGGRVADEPFILGHEFAGTIDAVGADPRTADGQTLSIGQRVAVDPAVPCGQCECCREGNPNLCPHHHFFGVPPDAGALREFAVVPARNCWVLPDATSAAVGALLEPLGVAMHATDLAKLRIGQSVAIFGAGPIGLLILSLARRSGADPICVFEPVPERRAKARELGATHAWDVPTDATDAAVLQPLREATAGRGVDVAIEAADAHRSVDLSFGAARPGGRAVLVGIPADDRTHFSHAVPRRKGLTVRFARRMKHTYPRALALAQDPDFAAMLEGLITHRFPLAETAAAYDLVHRQADGVIKAIIE
ncbi:alcohol dehydrogenase catalytic domain-containing protein [Actomonas aquatica]|uniref:Alcohol dehydrogenase catalytic domain-containing protein n=1 Tax=Actomonas aquatica TaxID=2866162 RepID=A0ABZ1C2U9_9BACT|nr:alcohol dehydrogenase catalytic domain-containing protein [Opitutus sp. WL0086]WRQ85687.1 alcohol dehydrogenase catalytic domain-containing protein [Opitutus sp. WL0086]